MNPLRRAYQLLSSVKTGIVLLLVVTAASVVGTVVLQRPITEAADLERAYSPAALAWLDRLGLTDVFHAWWFLSLMVLFSLSIILASLERWPRAWKVYSQPMRYPAPALRAGIPFRREFAVPNSGAALDAAFRALRRFGFKPQLVEEGGQSSLFAERHRFAVMGVFVVHLSLLLIMSGGVVDGFFGYKGFVVLSPGEQTASIDSSDAKRALPFALRCDGTGQENYEDGTPKKWWSDLVVLEDGKEVLKKHIVVNDPLIYKGIRFFQASYGNTGTLDYAEMLLATKTAAPTPFTIKLGESYAVAPDASLKLVRYVPEYYKIGDEVFEKSQRAANPAFQFLLTKAGAPPQMFWFFPVERNLAEMPSLERAIVLQALHMTPYTGLQVTYSPGHRIVWTGCVLMLVGLAMSFYFAHQRVWAVPVTAADGSTRLWLGGSPSKNRERFRESFEVLVQAVAEELQREPGNTSGEDGPKKVACIQEESI